MFLAKARGGTCTLAVSDPTEVVVDRVKYLLENGFGCYNVFKNNCEDFAIYCKTGLLVLDQGAMGQGGQVASILGGPLALALATPLRLVTTNVYGMAVSAVAMYCVNRYAADIGSGMRRDVVKVSAEDLTRRLSTGLLQVIEPPRALSSASWPLVLCLLVSVNVKYLIGIWTWTIKCLPKHLCVVWMILTLFAIYELALCCFWFGAISPVEVWKSGFWL